MYSKPLSSRLDGAQGTPTKVKRGAPLNPGNAFSSFMPQGTAPALPGLGLEKSPGRGATPLEQAATQNNLGLNQMRALAALTATQEDTGPQSQNTVQGQGRSLGLPLNPRDMFKLLTRSAPDAEAAEMAVRVASHRKGESLSEKAAKSLMHKMRQASDNLTRNTGAETDDIGKLAAQFESGSKGIAAIGYDRHGGTSYGKYQISSRAGTMSQFLEFCRTEAPDIAEKLEKSGGSMNTGGRNGKMPTAWTAIAASEPERFEELQDKFIRNSHFEPALRAIAEKTGLDKERMPFALQEVVFSTAVQHGPNAASRIISRAMDQVGQDKLNPETSEPTTVSKAQEHLIRKIYDNRSGQFRSSEESVQAAVKSRLRQEMSMAITMLRQERTA